MDRKRVIALLMIFLVILILIIYFLLNSSYDCIIPLKYFNSECKFKNSNGEYSVSFCDNIDSNYVNNCNGVLSVFNMNKIICDTSNTSLKDNCYFVIANKFNDNSICEKISNLNVKSDCYRKLKTD